jgi:hypothetical protein
LATYLETELDRAAAVKPNPGRPIVHRLNRAEYVNAIRDLLAIDTRAIDIQSLLPTDDSGYGFDNIGDVLSVSPMLMEGYMSASRKISRMAIGDPGSRPEIQKYDIPMYVLQEDRMSEDLPFGSRGGIVLRHNFPLDGEYIINIRLQRNSDSQDDSIILGLGEPHQLDLRLDGERIRLFTVGGVREEKSRQVYYSRPSADPAPADQQEDPKKEPAKPALTQAEEFELDAWLEVRIPVKAGIRLVGVTFVTQPSDPEGVFQPEVTDYSYARDYGYADVDPAVGSITIAGPYGSKGAGDTVSRRKMFICRPTSYKDEERCARKILSVLTRHAYRRPVEDEDLRTLLGLYKTARSNGGFEEGIRTALQRILVDPEFLFRIERDPANVGPDTPYRITDLELASRLSFFLWSSIPDDELLDLAERGKLKDRDIVAKQVRRMLNDSRSRALVSNFAGQWLYLRNIAKVWPNPDVFPDFATNLRDAFEQETELFFESLLREDLSVLELLDANYTFLNERLARHYGIPNIYGSQFRRVTLSDENRKGLLGQASILTVTSYATRTAPTIRGKWVLENILGTPPPPPPPNVPSLGEGKKDGKLLTMREQMEEHRKNPACASCHRVMDPLGFALENFDATGRWRTKEGETSIDASGVLPDGTKFQGPAELRKLLLNHPEQFVHTLTEKLLTYALGRGVEYYDAPAVREILRKAETSDYRWSSIILGIVNSAPFQMRRSRPS